MVKVTNLSGGAVGLDIDGFSYTIPQGAISLDVNDGATFSVVFSGTNGGMNFPGGGGNDIFTEFGALTIWADSYEFESSDPPVFYFMEGVALGILVFGTGWIYRILKNVARSGPLD